MKHFFSLLLVGLLAVPTSGCASTTASAAREQESNAVSNDMEKTSDQRVVEIYQLFLNSATEELIILSGEINEIPIITPETDEVLFSYDNYLIQINAIEQVIDDYRMQIADDFKSKNLSQDDYDALTFQCDQLDTRADSLRGSLSVIYGACLEAVS